MRHAYLQYFTRYQARSTRRRPIAVFDMETADATLTGRIAGIAFTSEIDYPHIVTFSRIEGFLQHFLTKRYRGFVAYAHRALSFDLTHIFAQESVHTFLMQHGFTVIIEDSFVVVRRNKHTWKFGDSYRLIPTSLEKAIAIFAPHLAKAPLPSEPFSWENPRWRERLIGDVKGLYECLVKLQQIFAETFGVSLSLTMPATALRAARTMLPVPKIARPPDIVLDWLRAGAYSGGRIEVFAQGEFTGHIYCLDINSAYAAAMKGEFPIGAGRYTRTEPKTGYYIARCWVTVPDKTFIPPVLSRLFVHKFAVGTFQAMLTKEEVEFAREHGARVTIIEAWAWTKTLPVFRAFIEKCETLRRGQHYHDALGHAVKLAQNGLYGILGMNPFKRVYMLSQSLPPLPWVQAWDSIRQQYLPTVWEARLYRPSPHQMPHWAAIITARVRIALTRYLYLCQQTGLRPLYAHTDSLWVHSRNGLPADVQRHIHPSYGALKMEYHGTRALIVSAGEAALWNGADAPKIASRGWRPASVEDMRYPHTVTQTQMRRVPTAARTLSVGRVLRKHVADYTALSSRHPARRRPGLTSPRRADAYWWDEYWALSRWRIGHIFVSAPLPSRWRCDSIQVHHQRGRERA